MSHFTHPHISWPIHLSRRATWLAALVALAVTGAVVLVIAIGSDSSSDTSSVGAQAQPSLRSGGGPEESGVAASVGSRATAGPSESATAAAVSAGSPSTDVTATGGPDESSTAAALSGHR